MSNRLPVPEELQHLVEKRASPRRAEDESPAHDDSGQAISIDPLADDRSRPDSAPESKSDRRVKADRRQSPDS